MVNEILKMSGGIPTRRGDHSHQMHCTMLSPDAFPSTKEQRITSGEGYWWYPSNRRSKRYLELEEDRGAKGWTSADEAGTDTSSEPAAPPGSVGDG